MSLLQRVRRIPVLLWIIVPVALAALVAWPLGGWDTVTLTSRTLPAYLSNQTFHTHRFDLRVDDAWLTADGHPAGYSAPQPPDLAHPPEIYLVVRVDATNVTDDAASSADLDGYLAPVIDGEELDSYSRPSYVLVSDRTTLPELNPGVKRELFLVWTIAQGSVEEGDDLRIDLYDATPHVASVFYGLRWDFEEAGYAVRNVDAT